MSNDPGIIARFVSIRQWSEKHPNGRLAGIAIAAPLTVMGFVIAAEQVCSLVSGSATYSSSNGLAAIVDLAGTVLFGITAWISALLLSFACVRALIRCVAGLKRFPTSRESADSNSSH
jgi:hypothetical protein